MFRGHSAVCHPNPFMFVDHLHRATVDCVSDRRCLENERRPRKKQQQTNDTRMEKCFEKYDNGCSFSVL